MEPPLPKGLVFSTTSPRRKKRAILLVLVLVMVQLGLIWPVYPMFSSPTPQIFGFPLSLAWVIGMLALSFISLLLFFLTDNYEDTESWNRG